MSTTTSSIEPWSTTARTLGIARLAFTGGLSLALIMVLCWIGTFIPLSSPTHAYISLFTPADIQSAQALIEGTLWSFGFGVVAGAVFAIVYNGLARLEKPRN